MRVDNRGGSSGIGGRVASNGWRLLLLVLIARAALGGEMHAPRHVMFTPVELVLAHLLGLLVVTVLGRDLLPCLVLLLPDLVAPVYLVPSLLVIIEGVFEILVGLKAPFSHGNNLFTVRRFGAPLSSLPEPIILAQGGCHEGLVSEIDVLAVKVVVVVAPDVV